VRQQKRGDGEEEKNAGAVGPRGGKLFLKETQGGRRPRESPNIEKRPWGTKNCLAREKKKKGVHTRHKRR